MIFFLFFFKIHFNASDCLQDLVSQFQCDAKCVEKKIDQRVKMVDILINVALSLIG